MNDLTTRWDDWDLNFTTIAHWSLRLLNAKNVQTDRVKLSYQEQVALGMLRVDRCGEKAVSYIHSNSFGEVLHWPAQSSPECTVQCWKTDTWPWTRCKQGRREGEKHAICMIRTHTMHCIQHHCVSVHWSQTLAIISICSLCSVTILYTLWWKTAYQKFRLHLVFLINTTISFSDITHNVTSTKAFKGIMFTVKPTRDSYLFQFSKENLQKDTPLQFLRYHIVVYLHVPSLHTVHEHAMQWCYIKTYKISSYT